MFLFCFQSQNPMEDPFVPTSEDLAGFWDMVYLQVQHVNSLFADLYELRRNNWTPKVCNLSNTFSLNIRVGYLVSGWLTLLAMII